MKYNRPIVLSIAGFDPSGGAGSLADVKTCEQLSCLGFSVLTANTIQSEDRFLSVEWIPIQRILAQMDVLFEQYPIAAVKIGIVESLDTLHEIIQRIRQHDSSLKIVWDPVVSSSTGFDLLGGIQQETLENCLQKLDLVTPNLNEVSILAGKQDQEKNLTYLAQFCAVYLKGGHSETELGVDYLITQERSEKLFPSSPSPYQKHGSGCILSAAIAAYLSQQESLSEACKKAKIYIEKTLNSNPHLLAYHHVG